MKCFKMHEAKTNFSKIVAMVEAGEIVEIKRRDKVVARIVPDFDTSRTEPIELGWARGKWTYPDDLAAFDREFSAEMTDIMTEKPLFPEDAYMLGKK